jgi:hypothetical protein
MLKKSGAIILAILYLVMATGFALNLHYCCSRLMSVNINSPAQGCKAATGKTKCCSNKHLEIKIKDVHHGELTPSFLARIFAVELPRVSPDPFFYTPQQSLESGLANRAPPDKPFDGTVTFLKNCTFRI